MQRGTFLHPKNTKCDSNIKYIDAIRKQLYDPLPCIPKSSVCLTLRKRAHTVGKEIKCRGETEILHELVHDTIRENRTVMNLFA